METRRGVPVLTWVILIVGILIIVPLLGMVVMMAMGGTMMSGGMMGGPMAMGRGAWPGWSCSWLLWWPCCSSSCEA